MDGHPNSSLSTWSALAWLADCLVVCIKILFLLYFPPNSHTISEKSNYNSPLKLPLKSHQESPSEWHETRASRFFHKLTRVKCTMQEANDEAEVKRFCTNPRVTLNT